MAFDDGFVVFSLAFSHINYWIDRCCCLALSSSFACSFDHPVEDDEEFVFVISIRSSSCARSFVRGPNLSSSHGNESRSSPATSSSPATASIIIQVATQMIVISIFLSLTTSHVTKYTHHLISIIITIIITIKTPTNQTRPIE